MNFISQYGKEIFAFAVPFFTFLLNKYFKNSAKLEYGSLHSFSYLITEPLRSVDGDVISPTQTVHTQSYVIRNEGRESASSVEIIFNFRPMYINIWPSRHYDLKVDGEKRHIMVFDYLAPQEFIRCEIMSINRDLPDLISVRCKEGLGKMIGIYPQKTLSTSFINFIRLQIFVGMASSVYIILIILQWLVMKTG
ncbi:hypothetical protein ACVWV0_004062 [Ewingella americana]